MRQEAGREQLASHLQLAKTGRKRPGQRVCRTFASGPGEGWCKTAAKMPGSRRRCGFGGLAPPRCCPWVQEMATRMLGADCDWPLWPSASCQVPNRTLATPPWLAGVLGYGTRERAPGPRGKCSSSAPRIGLHGLRGRMLRFRPTSSGPKGTHEGPVSALARLQKHLKRVSISLASQVL